jgi:hypothetical protein
VDALDGNKVLHRFGPHVDESAQAVVLAEVTTSRFVAGRAVLDFSDSIEPDERRLLTVAPQPQRLLCRRLY